MIKRILFLLLVAGTVLASVVAFAVIISNDTTEPLVDLRLTDAVTEWRHDMYRAKIDCDAAYNRINIIRVRFGDGLHSGCSDRITGEITVSISQLQAGPYSIKGTLYHELGHHVFHLSHGSCAIMRQQVWTEEEYREHWKEWTQEYLQECIKHEFESKY